MRSIKYLPVFLSSALTLGLIFLFNSSVSIGETNAPPFGKFLSPFTGFWQNTKADAYRKNQTFNFPELEGEVRVVYDDRMVPHIFAENHNDGLFVQGYVTMQDRLWQTDISTRSASGRLSEVLGERTLKVDKLERRKGMRRAAELTCESWKKDPESYQMLEAYVQGANAYISQLKPNDYPIEFKLLDYAPEPWSVLKMAQFGKSMERALCRREEDLGFSNALQAFGPATFEYLYPKQNPLQSPVIPNETVWDFEPKEEILDSIPTIKDSLSGVPEIGFSKPIKNYEKREQPVDFLGSNNWAVDGSKTKSGKPILANDPHLQMTLPAIWYEVQLKTPLQNSYGVSFPGLPGVVIGFNENMAWGTTNGAQDVTDWYKIVWADDSKKSYLLDGKPTPITEVVEEIKLKGGEVINDTVKYTVFGPIVHESEDSPYQDMAFKWIGNEIGDDFIWKTFWNFNTAKNHDDFITATNYYGHPNQNFVFADKAGDIALKVSGLIPVRGGDAQLVQDGSRSDNDWKGFLPQNEMPQVKNPERGFVSSANQNPVGVDYPHATQGIYAHYRSRIINRKLEEMSDITPQDMMLLQNNNYSILAEEMLPILIENLDKKELSPLQIGMTEILKNWNYYFEKDEVAPFLFEEWRIQFYKLMWDEIEELAEERPIRYPSKWRLIEIMRTDPQSVFFDIKKTPEREGISDIATAAFIQMTEKLKENLDDKNYTWEDYKSTDIRHIARLNGFSRDNISVGGYRDALNAVQNTAGPSWRMVVDLDDEVKGWGIFPGGQSGHPGSKYYDNFIGDWADGKFHELIFMKNKDEMKGKASFEYRFDSGR